MLYRDSSDCLYRGGKACYFSSLIIRVLVYTPLTKDINKKRHDDIVKVLHDKDPEKTVFMLRFDKEAT
jgi:hypothetical protein